MFKTKKEATAYLTVGLSATGKMPCPSWGLPALRTCKTGATSVNLDKSVCASCYACKGSYVWPAVSDAYNRRLNATMKPRFVEAMTTLIGNREYFRWHDSGDIYSMAYLDRIVAICKATPGTLHWIPTREARLIAKWIANNGPLPVNMTVRISGLQVDTQGADDTVTGFTSEVATDTTMRGVHCPATFDRDNHGSKCDTCRACWKYSGPVIYKAH